ncbi:MAG: hypothetical protein RL173_3329 [Fibrobacterota bacterium]
MPEEREMSVAWSDFQVVGFQRESARTFASTYRYGKTVSKALSISMHLAQHWALGEKVTAVELARDQDLPHPWVARLLGYLTRAGIVKSFRGPGGGYVLAKEPHEIRLWEVVSVFQRDDLELSTKDLVADRGLGLAVQATNQIIREYLDKTTLAIFVTASVPAIPSRS